MNGRRYSFTNSGYMTNQKKNAISNRMFYFVITLALIVISTEIWLLAYDISTDTNINSGIVIEKIGQNKPVVTWIASEDEWTTGQRIPDPNGWFVLVQDGNRYQRFRLTKNQYENIGVNARIWRFGEWIVWRNKR